MIQRRIFHIIPTLEQGGAERMLASFVKDDAINEHIVVKLFAGEGLFEAPIRAAGIRLFNLGVTRSPSAILTVPIAIIWLLILFIKFKPNIVVGWLYYGALVASLGQFLRVPVIWSIHAADFDLQTSFKRITRLAIKLCCSLSHHVPAYIQYCSSKSMDHHNALGFCKKRCGVVENGVQFNEDRAVARFDFGAKPARIACIARFEAQKDHNNLLVAASLLSARGRDFEILLAGAGCTPENENLARLIAQNGVGKHVRCLGIQSDVASLIEVCGCVVLASSHGEAMPMVLLEAIAFERPIVATDVGSSRQIVDRFGLIVPPQNSEALADALENVVWKNPTFAQIVQQHGRSYVIDNFSISQFVKRWQVIFETCSR